MQEDQVSNARRVRLTALALVAFWVLAIRGYWVASDLWHASGLYGGYVDRFEIMHGVSWVVLTLIGVSLASIPTVSLHTSTENRIIVWPKAWVWIAGAGFAFSCSFSFWLGEHDAARAYSDAWPAYEFALAHLAARQAHDVSWLWLLLPISLTTAFVICGAWRSAVKATEVERQNDHELCLF